MEIQINSVRSYVQAMQELVNIGFLNHGCITEVRTFPCFHVDVHTHNISCLILQGGAIVFFTVVRDHDFRVCYNMH